MKKQQRDDKFATFKEQVNRRIQKIFNKDPIKQLSQLGRTPKTDKGI